MGKRLFEISVAINQSAIMVLGMNSKLAASMLYSMDDATLIAHAGSIIGTHKLNLSIAEAVECVRNYYNNQPNWDTSGVSVRWEVSL
jgi:hypothetical protein